MNEREFRLIEKAFLAGRIAGPEAARRLRAIGVSGIDTLVALWEWRMRVRNVSRFTKC